MLRACHRVLQPEGRLAFYAIFAPPEPPHSGFDPATAGLENAVTGVPYGALLVEAGFAEVAERDVTARYAATARAWLDFAAAHETELRETLGSDVYEQKQSNRINAFAAIEAGSLRRSLFTARRPG